MLEILAFGKAVSGSYRITNYCRGHGMLFEVNV